MARTSRRQRLSLFVMSGALVGGGVLLPTSAFAAPALPHAKETVVSHVDHDGGHDKHKHKKGRQGPRDVENMPGCKYYKGKVYCELKPPPKPAPLPPPPGIPRGPIVLPPCPPPGPCIAV